MGLERLTIQHVRNIERAEIRPSPGLNVIVGHNAAGKTSLLEAIDLLSRGRSFRSNKLSSLMTYGAASLLVAGKTRSSGTAVTLGLEKSRTGARLRLQGRTASSVADLAAVLPVQIIHPESHALIGGSPAYRRAFIDWGVFHASTDYLRCWRRYQRALTQRNTLLRRKESAALVGAWDKEVGEAGGLIDEYRQDYLNCLEPIAMEASRSLLEEERLELSYRRGWPDGEDLEESLAAALAQDSARGYTGPGPHRAELRIRLSGHLASEAASRGQQKLLAAALRLAQTRVHADQTGNPCAFLVDDISAELDAQHRRVLLEALAQLNTQVFLTVLDPEQLGELPWAEQQMFHVKHGEVSELA